MKFFSKFFTVVAFFLAISVTAQAQRGDRQPRDPAEMAEHQTERMVEQLSLTETQAVQVQEINLAFAEKMQAAHENNQGDRTAMREIRTAIEKDKNAELQQILTAEQFTAYEATQVEKGNRNRHGRGGERSKK